MTPFAPQTGVGTWNKFGFIETQNTYHEYTGTTEACLYEAVKRISAEGISRRQAGVMRNASPGGAETTRGQDKKISKEIDNIAEEEVRGRGTRR